VFRSEAGWSRRAQVPDRGFPEGTVRSADLDLAKSLLVSLHSTSCDRHWGPCDCLLALAIRSVDSLQGLEAACEWQNARPAASRGFWAKTAKGQH